MAIDPRMMQISPPPNPVKKFPTLFVVLALFTGYLCIYSWIAGIGFTLLVDLPLWLAVKMINWRRSRR